jgi:hypothetical protein
MNDPTATKEAAKKAIDKIVEQAIKDSNYWNMRTEDVIRSACWAAYTQGYDRCHREWMDEMGI